MISDELLEILACPETHQPLTRADGELVAAVNAAVGSLNNHGGEAVTEPIDEGLVREDGKRLYPVRGDIPVLLIPEGINLPLK